ncbi:MAG: family 10 glycosylhydrolase [Oscillospiraceae bacterium]|nr:family 10 glycosylhydrolase [Oscillospiraceae bacterium]
MKKRIISLIAAAALGLCGCSAKEKKETVSVVDAGGVSLGSSEGVISYGSSTSYSVTSSSQSSSSSSESITSSTDISDVSSSSANSGKSTIEDVPSYSTAISTSENESSSSSASSSAISSIESSSSSSTSSSQPSCSTSTEQSLPPASFGANNYRALNYSEVKGMWISYIDLAGISSGSESAFRSGISDIYDNCKSLGINTVYVHVRSHGDAYYSSDYYPRTKYLGGTYDPLDVMIEEAHERGLSFQAWINPLRGCAAADIERENGYPMYNWAGGDTRLVQVGSYYYLNPAYSEVIELIANGAREITANYDVDGIHIDDYFYPTTDTYFDSAAFSQSGLSSLSEFRLSNCDNLVSSIYKAVKRGNSSAIFGVSCQGSMYNNYNAMFIDVKKWCTQSGYIDYIMPQIYYGFKNSAEPFEECVNTWNNLAYSGNIPLIVGITSAKLGVEDRWAGDGSSEWITDENILKRQFLVSQELSAYGGIGIYSYGAVFNADYSVKSQVDREIEALKAAMN